MSLEQTYNPAAIPLHGVPAAALSGSWYAVHVRSRFERPVATELAAKGIDAYVPFLREVHTWTDRRKTVEVPLFPGYVFARFEDSPATRLAIVRTTGSVRILGPGSSIEPIPDVQIGAIHRLIAGNLPLLTHPLLNEGALVRIRRGPLKDVEGLLLRRKNEVRLVVSVSLLSRSVSAEVDLADIEVLRAAPAPVPPAISLP